MSGALLLAALAATAGVLVHRVRSDALGRITDADRGPWWPAALGELHLPGVRARGDRTRRRACIELCQGFAAELHAGQTPHRALQRAVAELDGDIRPEFAAVAAAARAGTDIPAALEAAGESHGNRALAQLAACWRVGSESGGGFADVVERLAATLRAAEAHRHEISAQLAGPRATARLLAGLPVIGLVLAAAMGANPLAFLFGHVYGLICLALGLGLDAAGLWWTRRLAAGAELG